MKCDEARALIDLQVDGSLTAVRAAALQAHLAECKSCAQDLAELMDVRAMLAAARSDVAPAGVIQGLWPVVEKAGVAVMRAPVATGEVSGGNELAVDRNQEEGGRGGPLVRDVKQADGVKGRTGMSNVTATAGVAAGAASGSRSGRSAGAGSAKSGLHPKWRNAAVLSALMVAVIVMCYVIGMQRMVQREGTVLAGGSPVAVYPLLATRNSPGSATATPVMTTPPAAPGAAGGTSPDSARATWYSTDHPAAYDPTAPVEHELDKEYALKVKLQSGQPGSEAAEDAAKNAAWGEELRHKQEAAAGINGTINEDAERKYQLEKNDRFENAKDLEEKKSNRDYGEVQKSLKSPAAAPAPSAGSTSGGGYDWKTDPQTGARNQDRQGSFHVATDPQSQLDAPPMPASADGPVNQQAKELLNNDADTAETPTGEKFKYSPNGNKGQEGAKTGGTWTMPDGTQKPATKPGEQPAPGPTAKPDPNFTWHSGGTTGSRTDLYAPPSAPGSSTGARGDELPGMVTPAPQKPKIIKSGEIIMEVKSYAESSQKAIDLTVRFDGYLADNRVVDLPGGAKRGEITIRVLPEKFEALYGELKKIGKVETEREGAQDVTGAFSDTEARIRNLQISEARLQELVKSKTYLDRVEDLLTVERELEKTRGQIEEMQGQLNTWSNLIRYSSIRVVLEEPTTPQPSGTLSVEVAGLTAAKDTLDAALAQFNGKLLSGQTNKRPDGTLMGTYTVRVDLAHFGGMLGAIKGLGRVQDEKVVNQPFSTAFPEASANVPCDLALVIYEKSQQMPGGSVTVEVASVPEAVKKLTGIVTGFDGSVLSNQTSHTTTGPTTSLANAQMQLRVRAGSFAALLDALKGIGKITVQNVNGEVGSIQGGTADVPATLSLQLCEVDKGAKETPEGTLGLAVTEFTQAQEQLQHIVGEFKIDVKQADSRTIGKQRVAAYTLAIHADKIDDAVAALEKLGDVKVRQLKGIGLGSLAHPDPELIGTVVLSLEEKIAPPKPEPTGLLIIEAENFKDAQSKLTGLVKEYGVEVEASNSSQDGDRTVAAFTLSLPASKVDAAELALEGLGKVRTRQLSGIGLGGLAQFDADAKGHITLRLEEKPKPVDAAAAPSAMQQSWTESWAGFQNSLGAILRGFGVLLPWLAVLGLVAWLLRRVWKKGSREESAAAVKAVKAAEVPKTAEVPRPPEAPKA